MICLFEIADQMNAEDDPTLKILSAALSNLPNYKICPITMSKFWQFQFFFPQRNMAPRKSTKLSGIFFIGFNWKHFSYSFLCIAIWLDEWACNNVLSLFLVLSNSRLSVFLTFFLFFSLQLLFDKMSECVTMFCLFFLFSLIPDCLEPQLAPTVGLGWVLVTPIPAALGIIHQCAQLHQIQIQIQI